jgi:hypothetical protein
VHFDYCFLGQENEAGKTLPVLVMKERNTGMTMAVAVPTKSTGTYIAKRAMAFMKEIGCEYRDLVVKSDQEPAIKALVTAAGRLRAAGGGGKYIEENSPVGASQSNGVVERGIQSVAGQVRVLLDALEARWKMKIEQGHPIICYIVEYAAPLRSRS